MSCGDKRMEPGTTERQGGGSIPSDTTHGRVKHTDLRHFTAESFTLRPTSQQLGAEPAAFPQCTGGPVSPVGDAHVPTRSQS